MVILHRVGIVVVFLLSVVLFSLSVAGLYEPEDTIPEGFAPPWDVFNEDNYILSGQIIDNTSDSYVIRISVDQDDSLIYNKMYLIDKTGSGNEKWEDYTFPQETVEGVDDKETRWIEDFAAIDVTLDKDDYDNGEFNNGELAFLSYSCTQNDSEWLCGCVDQISCDASGEWNIQFVFFNDEPEDFSCTDNSDCDDGTECYNGECIILENVPEPECGNGIIEQDEECDTGSSNSNLVPNSCRTDCTLAICGDGVIDTGEFCDDGNLDNTDSCTSSCVAATCSDSYQNQDETGVDCGGTICTPCDGVCGNGNVESGEECDTNKVLVSGALVNLEHGICNGCFVTCQTDYNENDVTHQCETIPVTGVCGDGVINVGETCDDGNILTADGCSATCQTESVGETCGNGVCAAGETAGTCPADCTAPSTCVSNLDCLAEQECLSQVCVGAPTAPVGNPPSP